MSTLFDYRVGTVIFEAEPTAARETDDKVLETSGKLVDEYRRYVTYNFDKNGSGLIYSWPDEFGYIGDQYRTGGIYTDGSMFNFGSNDFTIKIQGGLAFQYPDSQLEKEELVPMLLIGVPGSTILTLGMDNYGAPYYVQKGDIYFTIRDENNNYAYGFMPSTNILFGMWSSIWQIELSRRGQVFTLNLLSSNGINTVGHTFNKFGAIPSTAGLPVYFFTHRDYGSTEGVQYAIQVTSGISRRVGVGMDGLNGVYHKYPSLLRKKAERVDISGPIDVVKCGYIA